MISGKDLYAPLLRNWIYPLAQRMQGRDFYPVLNAAMKDQFLSSIELKQLQFRKVSALINHAYNTVPFYQKSFRQAGIRPDDIRTLQDYRRIPVLTKEILRDHWEAFYSTKPASKLFPALTSGSTGRPLKIMVSQRAALRANVSRIRSLAWWGIQLGDREIRLTNTGFSFERGWKKYLQENGLNPLRCLLMNRKHFSAYTMTPKLMHELWKSMLVFSPKYFFGFPSAFTDFVNYLKDEALDGQEANLELVLTSGEVLHKWQGSLISAAFGCPVADEYGSIEMGAIAHSLPCGVMHTMDDAVYVEVLKKNPSDECGELVVTNLDNWSYPIIRYNLNDLAKRVHNDHDCSLGLGFSVLEGLEGRMLDVIRLKSGRIIYNHYFQNLIKHVGGVRQYQVIQKKPDYFQLKIVPDDESFDERQKDYIQDIIREHLEGSDIDVIIVSHIPRETSGKYRFVISEL